MANKPHLTINYPVDVAKVLGQALGEDENKNESMKVFIASEQWKRTASNRKKVLWRQWAAKLHRVQAAIVKQATKRLKAKTQSHTAVKQFQPV